MWNTLKVLDGLTWQIEVHLTFSTSIVCPGVGGGGLWKTKYKLLPINKMKIFNFKFMWIDP